MKSRIIAALVAVWKLSGWLACSVGLSQVMPNSSQSLYPAAFSVAYTVGAPLLVGLAKNVAFTVLPWTKITGVRLAVQSPPPNPPSGAFDGRKPLANWLAGPL